MLDESIMLLGCTLSKRLKPVGVMSNTILISPLLDTLCHLVGNRAIKASTIVYDINKFSIHISRKILIHTLTIENFSAKEL